MWRFDKSACIWKTYQMWSRKLKPVQAYGLKSGIVKSHGLFLVFRSNTQFWQTHSWKIPMHSNLPIDSVSSNRCWLSSAGSAILHTAGDHMDDAQVFWMHILRATVCQGSIVILTWHISKKHRDSDVTQAASGNITASGNDSDAASEEHESQDHEGDACQATWRTLTCNHTHIYIHVSCWITAT